MEFQELIEARRSIRKYAPGGEPNEEQLREIIAAAQQAPSWKNQQTTRYYAALGEESIKKLAPWLGGTNPTKSENAALVVMTFIKGNVGFDNDGRNAYDLGDGWGCYDAGLQTAYFILAAAEMGFGTLIMGIRDGKTIRKILSIPETEEITAVIAVGTPDQEVKTPPRKAIDDILKIV